MNISEEKRSFTSWSHVYPVWLRDTSDCNLEPVQIHCPVENDKALYIDHQIYQPELTNRFESNHECPQVAEKSNEKVKDICEKEIPYSEGDVMISDIVGNISRFSTFPILGKIIALVARSKERFQLMNDLNLVC